MIPLKFKAWDGNEWYEPDYIDDNGWPCTYEYLEGSTIKSGIVAHSDHPVVQYIGVKDYNGIDIYSGYIVRGLGIYLDGCIGEIVFSGMAFVIDGKKGDGSTWIETVTADHVEKLDVEIIGNIYETPELIEQAD